MKTFTRARSFLVITAGLLCQSPVSGVIYAQGSSWSNDATDLSYKYGQEARRIEVLSPDKKKTATVDGVKFDVVMNADLMSGMEKAGVGSLAELLWSPNSAAFCLTESDGGLVGTWRTSIFEIKGGRVHAWDASAKVVRSFKKHYKCEEQEEPNVGAVRWLRGGRHLLVVAEVPPHSSCPEMGKLRGYVIESPTGKIVREFDEKKLRSDWGRYLGRRLRRD